MRQRSVLSLVCLASFLATAQAQKRPVRSNVSPPLSANRLEKENRELKKRVGLLEKALSQSKSHEMELSISHALLMDNLLARLPRGNFKLGQIPTVQQGLLKALELSRRQRLFSIPEPKAKQGDSGRVFYQKVRILGARQSDGSVKISFSRPEGSANGKLFQVVFSKAGMATQSFGPRSATPYPQETVFNKAVSLAYSLSSNSAPMEFVVLIVQNKADHTFNVLPRSDYPGGGSYEFSRNGELLAVIGGL